MNPVRNLDRREIGQMPRDFKGSFVKKFIFLVLFVAIASFWFCGQSIWIFFTAKGYQSVFLSNGQVYFGKLSGSGPWLVLSDIYYLQAPEPLQQTGGERAKDSNQNIQLVKLGNELHGPLDAMYIERDQVLFWENLKDDSRVVDAISKYKTK